MPLISAAATSLDGVRATLRNLALTLAGLSLAVWTLALVTGRRLCRIALRPLTEMADAAHAIGGDEPGRRLPAPATDDELGELGRSFNALLDRLGESLERQQRFTGDASHQLGTPLTALQGQVDLALRQDRSPEEYRRVLALVRSKTQTPAPDRRRPHVPVPSRCRGTEAQPRTRSLLDAWLRESRSLAKSPPVRRHDYV